MRPLQVRAVQAWIPTDKISISTKFERSIPLQVCGDEPRGGYFEAGCLPWMGPVLRHKAETTVENSVIRTFNFSGQKIETDVVTTLGPKILQEFEQDCEKYARY